MRPVVDRNVVMRRVTIVLHHRLDTVDVILCEEKT